MNNITKKKILLDIPFVELWINKKMIGELIEPADKFGRINILKNKKKVHNRDIRNFRLTNIDKEDIDIINEYIINENIVYIDVKCKNEVYLECAGIIKALEDNIIVFDEYALLLDDLINKLKLERNR